MFVVYEYNSYFVFALCVLNLTDGPFYIATIIPVAECNFHNLNKSKIDVDTLKICMDVADP